jgi:hypothetical protein
MYEVTEKRGKRGKRGNGEKITRGNGGNETGINNETPFPRVIFLRFPLSPDPYRKTLLANDISPSLAAGVTRSTCASVS